MLYKNDIKRREIKQFAKYAKKIRFYLGRDDNVEALIKRLHQSLQKGDLTAYFYVKGDLDFLCHLIDEM